MSRKIKEVEELIKVRERTVADLDRLRANLLAEIEPASATDDDSADVAADIYERSKTISLIQSLEGKLRSIDHAIETAAAGKYGICEICGDAIPAERLAIMPETTICVRCASKLEQGIRRRQLMQQYEERRNHFEEDDDMEEDSDYDQDFSSEDEE